MFLFKDGTSEQITYDRARVAVRMDSTNSAIQEIQLLEERLPIEVLKSVKDLKHVESPSEADVLRSMPLCARGQEGVYEVFRDDIEVVTERIIDKVDPPRLFPLVGQAQPHHCHWKSNCSSRSSRSATNARVCC